MRALVLVIVLSSLAHADASIETARPHDFERYVRALAARRGQHIVAMWRVNLDGDLALERVAVLYDDEGGHGDFVIEKTPRQRWDVRFYADGRTVPTESGEHEYIDVVPGRHIYDGPHARRPNTILYRFGHRGGYADSLLALRHGRVAVVYEEELDDARAGDKPVATDESHYIEPGDRELLGLRDLD